MRIMNKKQETTLSKLIELAQGDFSLVEDALRNATPGKTPTTEEVVRYILLHRDKDNVPKHAATG
jgi:hypothetical protein